MTFPFFSPAATILTIPCRQQTVHLSINAWTKGIKAKNQTSKEEKTSSCIAPSCFSTLSADCLLSQAHGRGIPQSLNERFNSEQKGHSTLLWKRKGEMRDGYKLPAKGGRFSGNCVWFWNRFHHLEGERVVGNGESRVELWLTWLEIDKGRLSKRKSVRISTILCGVQEWSRSDWWSDRSTGKRHKLVLVSKKEVPDTSREGGS